MNRHHCALICASLCLLILLSVVILPAAYAAPAAPHMFSLSSDLDFVSQNELDELLLTVDHTHLSGQRSVIAKYGNSDTLGGLLPNQCAFNAKDDLFYFNAINMTVESSSTYLYTVDLKKGGSIVSRAGTVQAPLMNLELDTTNGLLYGVTTLNGTTVLVQVNPKSSAPDFNIIVKIPDFVLTLPALSAYCSQGHKFFFVVNNQKKLQLIRVDTATKTILTTTTLTQAIPSTIAFHKGTLYATVENQETYEQQLVTLDFNTGKIIRVIASLNDYSDVIGGAYLDIEEGKYYVTMGDERDTPFLVSIGLEKGEIQSTPALNYVPLCLFKNN